MFEEFNISAMADAYIVPYAANIALALAIFLQLPTNTQTGS